MSTSTSVTTVVLVDDPMRKETIAVAGFLAGYCRSTGRSYATDLRLFAAWCHEANLTLFSVRRAHLELYGRWMEETGRMRSTVARRPVHPGQLLQVLRPGTARRPQPRPQRLPAKVDYESRTLALDRNELGAFLVQAGLGTPRGPRPGVATGPQRTAHLRGARCRHREPPLRAGTPDAQDRAQRATST